MDLVELQQSASKIRNPFGFDFVWTWNKKPVKLVGDNQWKSVIKPLRDHLAWHLFNKIRNQYHDEQVAKFRAAGNETAARGYRNSRILEDKIWFMITGEHRFTEVEERAMAEQQAADLTELNKEISALENSAGMGTPLNVSAIIDDANTDSLSGFNDGTISTTHKSGSAQINKEEAVKDKLTEHIDNATPAAPVEPTTAAPANPDNGTPAVSSDFGDLNALE